MMAGEPRPDVVIWDSKTEDCDCWNCGAHVPAGQPHQCHVNRKLADYTLSWIETVLEDEDYRKPNGGGYTRAELFDYMLSVIRAPDQEPISVVANSGAERADR